MRPSKRVKLKIDQREDKIQIGDTIICFSLFLYFYFILTHISSEYQYYIYQVMQKFNGEISGYICLQKCARYLQVPGAGTRVPALAALAGAGAGAGVKNIGFLRQVPAPATGTRVSSNISIQQKKHPSFG